MKTLFYLINVAIHGNFFVAYILLLIKCAYAAILRKPLSSDFCVYFTASITVALVLALATPKKNASRG